MDTFVLVLVLGAALLFTYANGFRDSSHAVATSVSTRSLTPRIALLMAAFMNFAGAFLGTEIARTVSEDLITPPSGRQGLLILLAALIGAVAWHLVTWYVRLPASSTHALLGGLLGAALASASGVHWDSVLVKVVIPLLAAPAVGLLLGYVVMVSVLWAFHRSNPHKAQRGLRIAQTVSTAGMSLGHGLQDAQKTMGVMFLALITVDAVETGASIPLWVTAACAAALALGTYAGGWRIMRVPGRRVMRFDPARGFAAETTATSAMYTASYLLHLPVATTHLITSASIGVDATRRLSAVRGRAARTFLAGWLLTLPGAAAIAAAACWLLRLVSVA